jgi:hypothetical protein
MSMEQFSEFTLFCCSILKYYFLTIFDVRFRAIKYNMYLRFPKQSTKTKIIQLYNLMNNLEADGIGSGKDILGGSLVALYKKG